jgi:preprotein translocase subunit SecG
MIVAMIVGLLSTCVSILVQNEKHDQIASTLAWFLTYFFLMTLWSAITEPEQKPEEATNDAG